MSRVDSSLPAAIKCIKIFIRGPLLIVARLNHRRRFYRQGHLATHIVLPSDHMPIGWEFPAAIKVLKSSLGVRCFVARS